MADKKANPTLKQIADLSGFSTASVSMILSKRSDVSFSEETVRLVHEAAEKLGYRRRAEAPEWPRAIDERLIAVLCPNISNPYYSTLVQAIEQSAWEKGFRVLVLDTYRSAESEARSLELLKAAGIGGIIFTMAPQAPEMLELASKSWPVVVIGDKGNSLNIDTVEMDNYSAGVLLARCLIELGHEHIAYVSTSLNRGNAIRLQRLKGVEDTLRARYPKAEVLVRSLEISPADELKDLHIEYRVGYELAKRCLDEEGITAFVAVNDMVAYGVIDAIRERKLSIPEDYSVCGFDNIFPSRLAPISLTTVDNFIVEKGHNAFAMLYGKIVGIKGDESSPEVITRIEYSPRLIVRASTGGAREPGKGAGR